MKLEFTPEEMEQYNSHMYDACEIDTDIEGGKIASARRRAEIREHLNWILNESNHGAAEKNLAAERLAWMEKVGV